VPAAAAVPYGYPAQVAPLMAEGAMRASPAATQQLRQLQPPYSMVQTGALPEAVLSKNAPGPALPAYPVLRMGSAPAMPGSQAQAQAEAQGLPQYERPFVGSSYVLYSNKPAQLNSAGTGAESMIESSGHRSSSAWPPEDDRLLRKLKEEKKLGWREIASYFPNRTLNACQFRWRRLVIGVSGKKDKKQGVIEEVTVEPESKRSRTKGIKDGEAKPGEIDGEIAKSAKNAEQSRPKDEIDERNLIGQKPAPVAQAGSGLKRERQERQETQETQERQETQETQENEKKTEKQHGSIPKQGSGEDRQSIRSKNVKAEGETSRKRRLCLDEEDGEEARSDDYKEVKKGEYKEMKKDEHEEMRKGEHEEAKEDGYKDEHNEIKKDGYEDERKEAKKDEHKDEHKETGIQTDKDGNDNTNNKDSSENFHQDFKRIRITPSRSNISELLN